MTKVKTIAATALVAASLLLGACHTLDGAGEDVSSAGNSVQRAAQ